MLIFQIDTPSNLGGKLLGGENARQGIKISKELVQDLEYQSEYIGVQVGTS